MSWTASVKLTKHYGRHQKAKTARLNMDSKPSDHDIMSFGNRIKGALLALEPFGIYFEVLAINAKVHSPSAPMQEEHSYENERALAAMIEDSIAAFGVPEENGV